MTATDPSVQVLDATVVIGCHGTEIGKMGQVDTDNDTNTGQPTSVTVQTGWFGTSESFVPLDAASIDGDMVTTDDTSPGSHPIWREEEIAEIAHC